MVPSSKWIMLQSVTSGNCEAIGRQMSLGAEIALSNIQIQSVKECYHMTRFCGTQAVLFTQIKFRLLWEVFCGLSK